MNIINQKNSYYLLERVNMSRFYVYRYLREDKTPYYIGKGQGYRAYDSHPRQLRDGVIMDLRPKDKDRIEIIKYFDLEEDALSYEKELIATLPNLHNILEGGSQPPNHKGKTRSKETRQKISESKKGDKNPAKRPEVREKNRLAHLGRKHSEETIEKMKNRPGPNKGKTFSEEYRQKLRDAKIGKPWSEARRQAQVNKNK